MSRPPQTLQRTLEQAVQLSESKHRQFTAEERELVCRLAVNVGLVPLPMDALPTPSPPASTVPATSSEPPDSPLTQRTETLQRLCEELRRFLRADECSVWTVLDDQLVNLTIGARFPKGGSTGIVQYSADRLEVCNVIHAHTDERFDPEMDGQCPFAIVCVPVQSAFGRLTVLRVTRGQDKRQAFAAHTEVVLHHACMYAASLLEGFEKEQQVRFLKTKLTKTLGVAHHLGQSGLDLPLLVHDVMANCQQLTNADRCALWIIHEEQEQLEGHLSSNEVVRVPLGTGVASLVARTGQTINIADAYADQRFIPEVDELKGYHTNSILSMPVSYEGQIMAVAQLVNKRDRATFTQEDVQVLQAFSTLAGLSLRICDQYVKSVKNEKQTQVLVSVLSKLASVDVRYTEDIVDTICENAALLINADRCSLFMRDEEHGELWSKAATKTGGRELRFNLSEGIAGYVARTGQPVNVADAYSDPRFNPKFDRLLGYSTASLLAMPILHERQVIAVIQLVNKVGSDSFSSEDEVLLQYFCMFAGIALHNTRLFDVTLRTSKEAMSVCGVVVSPTSGLVSLRRNGKSSNDLDLLNNEVAYFKAIELTEEEIAEFKSNKFSIHQYKDKMHSKTEVADRIIPLLVELFRDLDLLETFKVNEDTLYRFLIEVRRKYRDVPYHNFWHACDVTQTMYLFIAGHTIRRILTPLDQVTLLVASLVHDLDHMGLNNSFHLRADTPMGILSAASGTPSVLEVHHCKLAIDMLADSPTNLFQNVPDLSSTYMYKSLVHCILATDMARHTEFVDRFRNVISQRDPNDEQCLKDDERLLLMQMLLKAVDISNIIKPFDVARLWAICVTEEFYSQGDMEKQKGLAVLDLFNREKAELAKGQLGFIDFVGIPFWSLMAQAFPCLQWTVDNLTENRRRWQDLSEAREQNEAKQRTKGKGS